VGSGKSTLINSILGEVKILGGINAVRGSLSYFSQAPFILNATIRDNILFAHVNDDLIDEERYQKALDCCALRHDLKMLAHGDQTEIGERGVTLSGTFLKRNLLSECFGLGLFVNLTCFDHHHVCSPGGQKARVALARAVYHNADISLIDDALSAVDAHVAKHLFHQCIVDELLNSSHGKKRTVILVTNAFQFLRHPRVDKIVVLNDGRVAEQGTYQELARRPNSLFGRFLNIIDETGIKRPSPSLEDEEDETFDGAAVQAIEEAEVSSPLRNSVISVADGPFPSPASTPNAFGEEATEKTMLMTEESRSNGHVGKDVYLAWAKAAGGYWVPVVLLLIFGATEGISVLSKWYLTHWSSHAKSGEQSSFLAVYSWINGLFVVVVFL
jgi:ABC-type multidrug transport system ATPase subunit